MFDDQDTTVLVTCFGYDEAGRQNVVYHPDGTVTRQEFDGLGRLLLTIENADDSDVTLRQITARKYDSIGRLELMAAVLPNHQTTAVMEYSQIDWDEPEPGSLQTTKLIYGSDGAEVVDAAGNVISRNRDLIHQVQFPDESGQPGEGNSFTFQYLPDGMLYSRTDQCGVVFTHSYDVLGRRIQTDIDDAICFEGAAEGTVPAYRVNQLKYEYSPTGEPTLVSAYTLNDAGQYQIIAENEFQYDSFRNLIKDTQAHFYHVYENAPSVAYGWDICTAHAGGGNYNRLSGMWYPTRVGTTDRRVVGYTYGGVPSCEMSEPNADNIMNRITEVYVDANPVALYQYTGSSRRVVSEFANGTYQTVAGEDGYSGLDRFGRLIDLHYTLPVDGIRYQHAYDKAGNQLFSHVTQAEWASEPRENVRSWKYAYDRLNRLIAADLGTLDTNNESIEVSPGSTRLDWRLDNLGNWAGALDQNNEPLNGFERFDDVDGDGVVDEYELTSQRHEVFGNNQFYKLHETTITDTTDVEAIYDAAGNLVSDGKYFYQYDGFNRLVQVNELGTAEPQPQYDPNSGTTLIGMGGGELGTLVFRYVYDGLGRIIRKYRIQADGLTALRYEDYYYDGIRRVQDVIRKPLTNGTPPPPCEEMQPVRFDGTRDPRWVEAVGPTITYALEPCDYGPDPNAPIYTGPTYESWTDREYVYGTNDVDEFILQIDRNDNFVYMLQDAGMNVVALVDDEGGLIRQDTYAPYGELISTDMFNLDHAPNSVGFKGLFFDSFHTSAKNAPLAPNVAGVYQNRNRTYHPHLGRFMQRDPNETAMPILAATQTNGQALSILLDGFAADSLYGNGMNLYQYLGSNPVLNHDPLGLNFESTITSGGPSRPDDWFAWAADVTAEIKGTIMGTISWLDDKITAAYSWGKLAANVAIGFLPGYDVARVSLMALAGQQIGASDIFCAALSMVPGGGPEGKALGKAAKYFSRTRAIYREAEVAQEGFKTFEAFKRAFGAAGEDMEWHHIVEQNKVGQFAAEQVYNISNTVAIPKWLNQKLNGHFGKPYFFTEGKTLREWLKGKSWEVQVEHGLEALKQHGG